jgi:hypothetical protein
MHVRWHHVGLKQIVFSCVLLALLSSASRAQETPTPSPTPDQQKPQSAQPPAQQTPPPEKKDDENPAEAAAEKAKDVTLQAAQATEKLGEKALVTARNWEDKWLTGVFVEKGAQKFPLTSAQRQQIYLQQTFTTPGPYMKRMFAAGFDQMRGVPYEWGGGWGGYSKRFASREGQFIIANSVAALGNAKLQYEPRYDVCQCSSFGARTRHAILRNFLTYNRTENELRPQWALYAGAFAGGLLSAAWKPGSHNALAEGGYAALEQAGYGSLLNFFIEFAGEINRKLGAKGRAR